MDLKFPDVGEGLSEGVLAKWLVKVGDTIESDQTIARVSTDKSVVDIPSSISGTVSELLASEGDTITVGDVILRTGDASANDATNDAAASSQTEAPAQSSEAPSEKADAPEQAAAETTKTEASANADAPQPSSPKPAPAPAAESSEEPEEHPDASHIDPTKRMAAQVPQKESYEQPKRTDAEAHTRAKKSSSNGVLALPSVRHYAREHHIDLSQVQGSGPDGRVTMDDLSGTSSNEQASQSKREVEAPHVHRDVLATPSVRRYARELDIDITTVAGSGENGRITREDLDAHASKPADSPKTQPQTASKDSATQTDAPQPATAPHSTTSHTPSPHPVDKQEPDAGSSEELSPVRKVIAQRMMSSHTNTAAVTHTDRADVTRLVELREEWKAHAKEHDVKLTYLPFFIKATIAALKRYPRFNASLDGETLTYHDEYHIGLAVDTERGLFVPVIRNADRKSIIELAREVSELAKAARDGTLTPEQMSGSTFTISSVGSLGGEAFTPIINEPNAAILGIGAIRKRPHVVNGELAVRDVLVYSLTYDHRIVDGADGARFLSKIIELTEDPDHLLLEMS